MFSFCAAIVIYPLRQLQAWLGLYLHIDDFPRTFASDVTLSQVEQVFHELRKFSAMSGLQLILGKSAYVTKGVLGDPVLRYMAQSGLQYAKRVPYLGVQVGHVSTKEAFLGPLREAFRGARLAATISLSIPERISLLKIWILPTLLLTARAYVADAAVTLALNNVYNVLFGFGSWGITAHQLSQHRDKGGYAVPMPKTWLAVQEGAVYLDLGPEELFSCIWTP